MPYYAWSGVDITGAIRNGRLFAKSEQQLDQKLLKSGIALLQSKPAWWRLYRSVYLPDTIQFFHQFSVLVRAGVLVPDALVLVADQLSHPVLQEAVHTIADAVNEGIALHDAMARYPQVFNSLMIQQVRIGHESGKLADALDDLCDTLEETNNFYTQMRAALMLPILTLLFFLGVTGVLFAVIVPRFADLFATFKQELPPLTKWVLRANQFVRSRGMLVVLASIVVCVLFIHWWRKTTYGKNAIDRLLVRAPFIGSIIVGRFTASFLQSLSLLLNSGMPLVPALEVARASIRNSQLREYVDQIKHAVEQGSSLHDAMMITAPTVFGPQVRAIVTIGQESGQLPHMLTLVAKIEQKTVMRQLRILTLLVQPLLMLMLGLLVALLIVAVYGPIINLSHAVSL